MRLVDICKGIRDGEKTLRRVGLPTKKWTVILSGDLIIQTRELNF